MTEGNEIIAPANHGELSSAERGLLELTRTAYQAAPDYLKYFIFGGGIVGLLASATGAGLLIEHQVKEALVALLAAMAFFLANGWILVFVFKHVVPSSIPAEGMDSQQLVPVFPVEEKIQGEITGEPEKIRIDKPGPGDVLNDPQDFAPYCTSYRVTGYLRSLPKKHTIWLLVQLPSSVRVRPQGFELGRVVLNRNGTWEGRVFQRPSEGKTITIIAVVAPPAVDLLFNYFQRIGPRTDWEPLDLLPEECTNAAMVQGQIP